MAKKKGSNIQRKNIKAKAPVIHPTLGNKNNASETEAPTEHVNSYTFTTIGMFGGLLVGYLLGRMNLGFGIGLLVGAIIDFILNQRKKKAFEKNFSQSLDNSTN